MKKILSTLLPCLLVVLITIVIMKRYFSNSPAQKKPDELTKKEWHAPDINSLPHDEEGNLIRYGKDLIANTSYFLGPKGKVLQITNGMSCQNCHLDAGTRPYGNSFAAVASTYPRYRERSGRVESIEFRIQDCMERSLNGSSIDSLSKEMKAMVAYLKWLGKDVKKGEKPSGSGIVEVSLINRAADPAKGKIIFEAQCQKCHGKEGAGLIYPNSTSYVYPPLWGNSSYNVSAGLYRLSRLAAFIKNNMPYSAVPVPPQLSDEDAWDVAAFISAQSRPKKIFNQDWPKLESKPYDFPFGPYADHFTEIQHKYGPFEPIKEEIEKIKASKK